MGKRKGMQDAAGLEGKGEAATTSAAVERSTPPVETLANIPATAPQRPPAPERKGLTYMFPDEQIFWDLFT